MATNLHLLIGTKKGLFILEDDGDWTLRGPFCETWPINHAIGDPATGRIHATGGNEWFGPAIWTSPDLGATWSHSSDGLAYPEGDTPVKAGWSLAAAHGALYAGVEPAGLFRSGDGGATWQHVTALSEHPSRDKWQPGGGGLILHHVLVSPHDAGEIWAGISTAGVFHSSDGGATWEPRNTGTRCDFLPEGMRYPEVGQCVHGLAFAAGNPQRLYQQNHCGMYRSDDGGRHWESIEAGLPSSFGFPVAAHPRDPETVFLLPLNGDIDGRFVPEAKAAVWRSRDAGANWVAMRDGLPQEDAYFGVMRQALTVDAADPAGVYFGTSSGSIYASRDEGDNWQEIAAHLPTVFSVEAFVA